MAINDDLKTLIAGGPWADGANADKVEPENSPQGGLTRSEGFPDSYSPPGTDVWEREVGNQMFAELYAGVYEWALRGITEWDTATPYPHPSLTYGSDNVLYQSVRTSTGQNPVNDSAGVDWIPQAGVSADDLIALINNRLGNDDWQSQRSTSSVNSLIRAIFTTSLQNKLQNIETGAQRNPDQIQDINVIVRTYAPVDNEWSNGDIWYQREA